MAVSEFEEAIGGQSSLGRIALVLDVLGQAEGMTLAELVRRTDIPRSSLHRLLKQMSAIRWVECSEHRYRLGVDVRSLGQQVVEQSRIHRAAIPWMYRLRDTTKLNVHLSKLSAFTSVNIDTVWGTITPTLFGVARQPAHCTASGKVLLAALLAKDPDLQDLPELEPVTRFTTTSKQRLRQELHQVWHDGMAVSRDECLLNWISVAVPIGPIEHATHALAVSGPSKIIRPHEIVRQLRSAAGSTWADATRMPSRRRPRAGVSASRMPA